MVSVAYSIVTDTHRGSHIRKSPQAALREIQPFLFKILKFLVMVSSIIGRGRSVASRRKQPSNLDSIGLWSLRVLSQQLHIHYSW